MTLKQQAIRELKKLRKYGIALLAAISFMYLAPHLGDWGIVLVFIPIFFMLGCLFYDLAQNQIEAADDYRRSRLMADFNKGMSWVYLAITVQYDPAAKQLVQRILKPILPLCECGHREDQHIPDDWKGYLGCQECACSYYYPPEVFDEEDGND